MHPESHACQAKRMSQRVKSCVHAARPAANLHGTAPPTRPATRPRHRLDTPNPRSLPRETHVRHACTKHAPNPIPTAQRRQHARGTPAACLKHADPPACHANATKMRTAPHAHARSARGAPARASLRAGFPHRATVSKTSSLPPRRPNRRI